MKRDLVLRFADEEDAPDMVSFIEKHNRNFVLTSLEAVKKISEKGIVATICGGAMVANDSTHISPLDYSKKDLNTKKEEEEEEEERERESNNGTRWCLIEEKKELDIVAIVKLSLPQWKSLKFNLAKRDACIEYILLEKLPTSFKDTEEEKFVLSEYENILNFALYHCESITRSFGTSCFPSLTIDLNVPSATVQDERFLTLCRKKSFLRKEDDNESGKALVKKLLSKERETQVKKKGDNNMLKEVEIDTKEKKGKDMSDKQVEKDMDNENNDETFLSNKDMYVSVSSSGVSTIYLGDKKLIPNKILKDEGAVTASADSHDFDTGDQDEISILEDDQKPKYVSFSSHALNSKSNSNDSNNSSSNSSNGRAVASNYRNMDRISIHEVSTRDKNDISKGIGKVLAPSGRKWKSLSGYQGDAKPLKEVRTTVTFHSKEAEAELERKRRF